MSFKAPESDPSPQALAGGGFKAPESDPDPSSYWDDVQKNLDAGLRQAPDVATKMAGQAATIGRGIFGGFPESGMQVAQGKPFMQTPVGEAVGAAGQMAKGAAQGIWQGIKDTGSTLKAPYEMVADDKSLGDTEIGQKFRERPISTPLGVAGTVSMGAGLLEGGIGAAPEAAAVEDIPKLSVPEAPPAAPAELPVVQPGMKTGDPHALFAYNDKFGPEGSERSLYNIFGDPEHPAIKPAGGWGSSVPEETLKANNIPITGRQPNSTKYEPISGTPTEPPVPPSPITPPIDPIQEVKSYIDRGKNAVNSTYAAQAKKPGWSQDVADYFLSKSQMNAANDVGLTPMQQGQLGRTPLAAHDATRALGQYALDSGIVDPVHPTIRGMMVKNESLMKNAGKGLEDIRAEADQNFNPQTDKVDVLQQIHQKFDPVYLTERQPGKAQYLMALKNIEDAPATFSGMSETATKLNKLANTHAKIQQPHTPFTELANEMSQINNERIKQLVPDKAVQYDNLLKEFGVNKKIQAALGRKGRGEVKRMGPGGVTSNFLQKGMDEIGYKALAKGLNKTSAAIVKNPNIASSLPSLFKEFIHHADLPEPGETGMAYGGIVGMHESLNSKYGPR